MTRSPSSSEDECPSVTVGRLVASTLRTASSCSESLPITRAWKLRSSGAGRVTVTLTAPSTTWKFVTMMPSDRTMNPVPTSFPADVPPKIESTDWVRVVMFTTAGATRLTAATTGSVFGLYAPPLDVARTELVEEDADLAGLGVPRAGPSVLVAEEAPDAAAMAMAATATTATTDTRALVKIAPFVPIVVAPPFAGSSALTPRLMDSRLGGRGDEPRSWLRLPVPLAAHRRFRGGPQLRFRGPSHCPVTTSEGRRETGDGRRRANISIRSYWDHDATAATATTSSRRGPVPGGGGRPQRGRLPRARQNHG